MQKHVTLLVGHPACKKLSGGVLVWYLSRASSHDCLERGADLHIAQLMPLPLTTVSLAPVNPNWFYQHGSAFLVPAYPGCPGKKAIKRM